MLMKKYLLLALLLLQGCAAPGPRLETSGFNETRAEQQDYDNFFYGSWLSHKTE